MFSIIHSIVTCFSVSNKEQCPVVLCLTLFFLFLKALGSVLPFVHLHFYPKCFNLSLLEIPLMVLQQTSLFTPFQLLQCCGLKQITVLAPLFTNHQKGLWLVCQIHCKKDQKMKFWKNPAITLAFLFNGESSKSPLIHNHLISVTIPPQPRISDFGVNRYDWLGEPPA